MIQTVSEATLTRWTFSGRAPFQFGTDEGLVPARTADGRVAEALVVLVTVDIVEREVAIRNRREFENDRFD
jgi:hypothetical protein